MKNINESIICAGFGGQGIMVLGKVLAEAGMALDLNVTWLPSYGAEVRGGTAHSMVRISSSPIPSPIVDTADTAIVMNDLSMDKFKDKIIDGGLLILNTSMAGNRSKTKDIDVVGAPLTEEAIKLNNVRVANMIAAGIFAAKKKLFDKALLVKVIGKMAAGREAIIPANIKAVERGFEIASGF
ncbi:MAG: 2-oxoacid:acceptor oxidoreductase family protein [Candidatus Omnitrophota bacterium]|nr:2-oxoacid:acceptor oxidoreductase family protein [Candidatus Omnitrophota bacterium]